MVRQEEQQATAGAWAAQNTTRRQRDNVRNQRRTRQCRARGSNATQLPCEVAGVRPATTQALTLMDSPERCSEVLAELEGSDRALVLQRLFGSIHPLALSKFGCRIVQKAIEVAGGSDRDRIITELQDHVTELYESPHGNHVLSKAIEVLPAAKNDFIVLALRGRAAAVSRHRYGCRVICRLIEHCNEDEIGCLLDEVVAEADVLARNAFGNFAVQSFLEHTAPARRSAILVQLLPGFVTLAMHRTGSLVGQRVLDYCNSEGQALAIKALLQGDGQNGLLEVACNHYGSYVIEQVAGLRQYHVAAQEAAQTLACNMEMLKTSEHAQRVIAAFDLEQAETSHARASDQ